MVSIVRLHCIAFVYAQTSQYDYVLIQCIPIHIHNHRRNRPPFASFLGIISRLQQRILEPRPSHGPGQQARGELKESLVMGEVRAEDSEYTDHERDQKGFSGSEQSLRKRVDSSKNTPSGIRRSFDNIDRDIDLFDFSI